MLASMPDANAYVEQFPAPLLTLVARCVSRLHLGRISAASRLITSHSFVTFIVGSVAAMLLVISVLNESVLLFYRIPSASADAEPRHAHEYLGEYLGE